jgi:hypothetical protein
MVPCNKRGRILITIRCGFALREIPPNINEKDFDNLQDRFVPKTANISHALILLDTYFLLDGRNIGCPYTTPFLAEMGDYRNYETYKSFIAFSGLDPSIHESGAFTGMSKLSKRGNRHLRRIIYLMTFCVIRIKGPFKSYFLKRRNEGLPFKKALFATAHKLIRAIFAMLTKRTHYVSGEMITG